MSTGPDNVVNPGTVNVADQGDGPTSVDQPVKTGPSSNAGPLVSIVSQGDGPTSVDQPVTVAPAQTAQNTVEGGAYSPESPNTINTTQNTVAGQTYGQGQPANVFV